MNTDTAQSLEDQKILQDDLPPDNQKTKEAVPEIPGIPSVDAIKERLIQLVDLRDAKIASADRQLKDDTIRVNEQIKTERAKMLLAARDLAKATKETARTAYKTAASQWKRVLRAREAEVAKPATPSEPTE